MKKKEVVKNDRDFNYIIKNGKRIKNEIFIVYYNEDSNGFPKFGIAVGKKVGNAVTRNKYKRKIRAIIDKNKFLFKNNLNYIIIMKKEGLDLNYQDLNKSLINIIEKVKE